MFFLVFKIKFLSLYSNNACNILFKKGFLLQEVKDYEIKALKKQIFISNLKAWIIGVILIAEIAFIAMYFGKMGLLDETSIAKNRVAVIRFNKPVTEEFTSRVMEEMDKVRENDSYKSVLFIMSSPGGSPTASEELSEYLKEYQNDLNVTMYVESIAASGGYYIASAIKPLIANKNAIVGSIGVIMPHYNFGELAKTVGVEEDYLAAGKFKKPISMLAKIDDENKEYIIKHLLKPTYDNFVQAVADNRGLKKEQIIPFTEGKIFIANVPEIQNILVDEVSSLYKVKAMIRENLDKEDLDFVEINLEEEPPFLPMVKVDLGLDELKEIIQLR
jgi:protease-4